MMRYLIDKFQLFCLWLVCDSKIRTGRLAPYIFGLGMGRMPHKVKDTTEDKGCIL